MTQLIKVDFKQRKVISRQDLKGEPKPAWKATSDERFKDFVGGIAMVAEQVAEEGGDWGQMIVVMHSTDDEGARTYRIMYDADLVTDDLAQEILRTASEKVAASSEESNEPA